MNIIEIKDLSKIYKLYPSKKERLLEALMPFSRGYHKDFYALPSPAGVRNRRFTLSGRGIGPVCQIPDLLYHRGRTRSCTECRAGSRTDHNRYSAWSDRSRGRSDIDQQETFRGPALENHDGEVEFELHI